MLIEKLYKIDDIHIEDMICLLGGKINELIDAVNNDGYYLAQPDHVSVEIKSIKDRLNSLENTTQPKEEESKLLNCPFCSNAYMEFRGINNGEIYIQCADCCANTGNFKTKQEAINAWNKRA